MEQFPQACISDSSGVVSSELIASTVDSTLSQTIIRVQGLRKLANETNPFYIHTIYIDGTGINIAYFNGFLTNI